MDNIPIRLKYFRIRAGLSQMQLELEIDAAFGSISRFESGKVNPTKESILKISKVLNLSDRELDYLIGPTSTPATLSELSAAQDEIKEYFTKKGVIAYLVDDRYRLIAFSKSFARILNINKEQQTEILYKTLPELLLVESYPTSKFFKSDYKHNVKLLLSRFKNEMGFMEDDPYYIKILQTINNNEISKRIWNEINVKNENISVFTPKDRFACFKILGHEFKMHYSNEQLQKFRRFDVVEYIPTDKLLKLFTRLF
jgi:transcriptional regulator with XRE-family HTH domain